MEMSTIMDYSKALRILIQSEGHQIKVNEDSYLVFESKEKYKNIKRLEKKLFNLVKNVLIKGINEEVYELERSLQRESKSKYRCGCESESHKLIIYMTLSHKFNSIASNIGKFPLTKVTIVELEKNENLDDPFEIKFPTLVYYFMTNHKKEEGYSNYKLFCKKIKSRGLVLNYDYLRESIAKAIKIK